ncbi:hypothetical protein BX661DRAFT_176787 [Kickxella alabastrina]|uniref:uncharacterized protein n=1 Tax=Kickxella alabastrina TaxID=61397 RepID=UPI00221F572B|nr:uncharacterized protein BX661DRAFT_176787 [Kickxella alabastrina]KAI7834196.1 hypothetical protein BX661DRAFT_176787 [Kickxella alabastrina]
MRRSRSSISGACAEGCSAGGGGKAANQRSPSSAAPSSENRVCVATASPARSHSAHSVHWPKSSASSCASTSPSSAISALAPLAARHILRSTVRAPLPWASAASTAKYGDASSGTNTTMHSPWAACWMRTQAPVASRGSAASSRGISAPSASSCGMGSSSTQLPARVHSRSRRSRPSVAATPSQTSSATGLRSRASRRRRNAATRGRIAALPPVHSRSLTAPSACHSSHATAPSSNATAMALRPEPATAVGSAACRRLCHCVQCPTSCVRAISHADANRSRYTVPPRTHTNTLTAPSALSATAAGPTRSASNLQLVTSPSPSVLLCSSTQRSVRSSRVRLSPRMRHTMQVSGEDRRVYRELRTLPSRCRETRWCSLSSGRSAPLGVPAEGTLCSAHARVYGYRLSRCSVDAWSISSCEREVSSDGTSCVGARAGEILMLSVN